MPKMIPIANSFDAFLGPIKAGQEIDVPEQLAERWLLTGFAKCAVEASSDPDPVLEEPESSSKHRRSSHHQVS
jgi:hypothetical protein